MNSPLAVRRADGVKGGDEIEQMVVSQDLVYFDVEREFEGEEYDVIWPHRQQKQHGKDTDAGEDGMQTAKRQICNDLVPGRMDTAGHG